MEAEWKGRVSKQEYSSMRREQGGKFARPESCLREMLERTKMSIELN